MQRVNDSYSGVLNLQRKWLTNKALRLGHQYFIWSNSTRSLREVKVPSYRERHVTNVVDPVIRTYQAQLLQNPGQWIVIPGSRDPEALMKTAHANKVLDYHRIECEWDEKEQEVSSWMFECGCSFVKVNFDPTIGPLEEATDLQGQPLVWPEGSPWVGQKMLDERGNPLTYQPGGVDIEVISPFQILIDPHFVGSLHDAPYIIQQTLKPLDWFEEHFEKGKHVTPSQGYSESLTLERQFMSIAYGQGRGNVSGLDDGQVKYAVYRECWVHPSKTYPKGRLICMGGDVVLQDSDSPYLYARGARPDRDWHPYVMFKAIPVGGRFWPMDVVGNIHGIQKAINRIISDAIEMAKLTAKPKWMTPVGTMPRNKVITSEPGEMLWYNSAYGTPHMSKPPSAPPYIFELLDMMFKNLDFVSLQHGPSRGQAPQGVRSGIGISLLAEQDERDINPISRLWEKALSSVGRKILLRVAQFWEMPRRVRIMGANDEFSAFMFSGADVSSTFDVICKTGSTLPKSRAATMAWYKDLVNMGVLLPALNPQHKRMIMEDLEVGTIDQRMTDDRQHIARARKENAMLERGIQPRVEWFQNHDLHLEEHLAFMNTDEYQRLLVTDQALEQRMNFHIVLHTMTTNQMVQQEMGAMQNPSGPGQEGARQGSVPMDGGNLNNQMGEMQSVSGLPQAGANAQQAGGTPVGMPGS